MKILKVNIKNLNSLRADGKPQTIDFQDERITAQGLFAIVGDTGSGKTTILDAITLALYGKTARGHESEVMTHGTTECFAEVEFEVKNKKYRAKWSQRRARKKVDGNLLAADYEIASLPNEKLLCRSIKTLVQPLIVEIIGLDYHQFKRSVMLAQGEFAEFLKSNNNERSDLLEKITGTERYSLISKAAFEKHKVEKLKLEHLDLQLKGLERLETKEIEQFETELFTLNQKNNDLESSLKAIEKQLNWLENLEKLENRQTTLNQKLATIQAEQKLAEPDFELLRLHEKAILHQVPLNEVKLLNKQIQIIDNQIVEQKNKLKTIADLYHKKAILANNALSSFNGLKEIESKKLALFEQVILLDNEIKNKELPITSLQEKLDEEINSLEKAELNLDKKKTLLANYNSFAKKTKAWLSSNKVDEKIDFEIREIELNYNDLLSAKSNIKEADKQAFLLKKQEEKLNKQQQNIQSKIEKISLEIEEFRKQFEQLAPNTESAEIAIQQLEKTVVINQKEISNLKDFINKSEQYILDNQALKSNLLLLENNQNNQKDWLINLKKLKEKISITSNILVDKNRIYDLEIKIKNYETERAKLQKGKPCPLCFSTEHNLDYHHDISKAEAEKKTTENLLSELKTEHSKLEIQLENVVQKIENTVLKIEELKTKNTVFEHFLVNVSDENQRLFKKSKLEGLIYKLKSIEDNLNQEQAVLAELRQLNHHINKAKANEIEAKSNLKIIENDLKNTIQNIDNQQIILNKNHQIEEKLSTDLKVILEKYDLNFETLDLINTLITRSQVYKNKVARLEKCVQVTALEMQQAEQFELQIKTELNEIKALKVQISDAKTALDSLKNERQTLFEDKNPKAEQEQFKTQILEKEVLVQKSQKELQVLEIEKSKLENSIAEKEKQLEQLQEVFAEKQKQLKIELKKNDFSDFEKLEKAILSTAQKTAIEANQKRLNDSFLQTEQSLKDNVESLKIEENKALTKKNKVTLITDNQDFKKKQNELQQQIGKIKNTLQIDKNNQAKAGKQIDKINRQKTELARWAALNEIIGQRDGQKFRIFAQSLTLRQLVSLANQHLLNLNPRYFIEKSATEDLGLEVVDTFQANTKRAMTTLSGGESFLVSLALALGLSDLAGQNTNIESLFIDEGFGTLDEKTLEDAISTLENLNNFGKTIGIISHVPALKEKISTQIRVTKKGGGLSVLELV